MPHKNTKGREKRTSGEKEDEHKHDGCLGRMGEDGETLKGRQEKKWCEYRVFKNFHTYTG